MVAAHGRRRTGWERNPSKYLFMSLFASITACNLHHIKSEILCQVPDTSPDTTVSVVSCTYSTLIVFVYWSWTVTMMIDWTGGTEQSGAENGGIENWMNGV